MKVTEIAFSCYAVTDIARSRKFYEEVLGLAVTMDHGMGEGGHWVEYDIGPGTLAIGKADGWKPSAEGCSVALEVDDFDQAVESLSKAGVKPTMGPFETPVCNMMMIPDPDDNVVIIHKRKPGHH